jgi:hypothetical protein
MIPAFAKAAVGWPIAPIAVPCTRPKLLFAQISHQKSCRVRSEERTREASIELSTQHLYGPLNFAPSVGHTRAHIHAPQTSLTYGTEFSQISKLQKFLPTSPATHPASTCEYIHTMIYTCQDSTFYVTMIESPAALHGFQMVKQAPRGSASRASM